MGRWRGNVIFIDRSPHKPEAGWGWVEVKTEDLKRFAIPNSTPAPRRVTKVQTLSVTRYGDCGSYEEPFINMYEEFIRPPSRGRSGGNKFTILINDEQIEIKAQKSLTEHLR